MNGLVVIDMQEEFETAGDQRTIANCALAIRRAMKRGERIFVVLYSGYGPLMDELQDVLGDYRNVSTITKNDDDGSARLRPVLRRHKITSVDVCGVNIAFCVGDTVVSLSKMGFKTRVLFRACNCWPKSNEPGQYRLSLRERAEFLRKRSEAVRIDWSYGREAVKASSRAAFAAV